MEVNNNPLNIKGDDDWVGRIGTDSRGHVIFDTEEHGIRAAARTMDNKWKAGQKTLRELIGGTKDRGYENGWAPRSDTQGSVPGNPQNDPDLYADTIALRVGIDADRRLPNPRNNPAIWANIIAEMSYYENGKYTDYVVILRGVIDWWDFFVKPSK